MDIHFRDEGRRDAPAVVLIHAFPLDLRMWSAQVEHLAKSFRVIVYDVRGHGGTPARAGQHLLDLHVDDLFALLDDLKLKRVAVCGLSMGGYIALRAVEREPGRFSALVLADTKAEPDTNEAKAKRAAGIRQLRDEGLEAFADGFLKGALAPTAMPETVASTRKLILAQKPEGLMGSLVALAARTDATPALAKFALPALVLVGDQDSITPLAAAETLKSSIKAARMQVIGGAGHLSNLDNPGEFNRHLGAFLREALAGPQF